jgi:hypothetical protein
MYWNFPYGPFSVNSIYYKFSSTLMFLISPATTIVSSILNICEESGIALIFVPCLPCILIESTSTPYFARTSSSLIDLPMKDLGGDI